MLAPGEAEHRPPAENTDATRWRALADTEEETARELEARLALGQVPEAHMDATLDLIAESRDLAERCRRRG